MKRKEEQQLADDIKCVLGEECRANTPQACLCLKMPLLVYKELYLKRYGKDAQT